MVARPEMTVGTHQSTRMEEGWGCFAGCSMHDKTSNYRPIRSRGNGCLAIVTGDSRFA